MTLRLIIEHSPHPQDRREMLHPGGEFSIGRGVDCNWQLNDPEQYVSRKHCVITGEAGQFMVTDASRGGLFIDGKDQPLGPGNSSKLEPGMRLRLGDTVIRIEIEPTGRAQAPGPQTPVQRQIDNDDFFSRPLTPTAPVLRPENLPKPFDSGTIEARHLVQNPERKPPPPMLDDPFNLDRSTPGRPDKAVPEPITARPDDFGFGAFFTEPARVTAPEVRAEATTAPAATEDWWGMPADLDRAEPAPTEPETARLAVEPLPPSRPAPQETGGSDTPIAAQIVDAENRTRQRTGAAKGLAAAPPSLPQSAFDTELSDTALRDAFYKGLGLEPLETTAENAADEMEALGLRFRLLVEGLVLMLRTRAKEKQNARVAQTVISNTDVNPLKFLASTSEALSALIAPRGSGYLPPDEAINAAFRDLADHQLRSWVAIQSALRRMIDRFDPGAIEKDMVEMGMIEALLAGGRNAKLWRLYTERYKDIARAAEDRFLGEVGADFRDAYEGKKGEDR